MPAPEFNDALEIGVPEIDAEHALQVQLVRNIKSALTAGDRSKSIELMAQLDDFTNAHFIAEQLLMRLNAYPGYRAHEDEHDRLIDDLRRLRHGVVSRQLDDSLATTSTIERWLIDHIQTADRALAAFLRQKAADAGPSPRPVA